MTWEHHLMINVCEREKKPTTKKIGIIKSLPPKNYGVILLYKCTIFWHFSSDCGAQNDITSKSLSKFMDH